MYKLQTYVRESCKAINMDVQVPITWQPEDRIQSIIDACVQQFPSFCSPDLARKQIGSFLKNCRKTEKRKEDRKMANIDTKEGNSETGEDSKKNLEGSISQSITVRHTLRP